jgi:hypothetical protein
MARWWSEGLDPERHRDFMSSTHIGGLPVEPADRLLARRVYFVRAAGFTFQFVGLCQLRAALARFGRTIHPTSRWPGIDREHFWQGWYERLPQWLLAKPRRVRVVAGLSRALAAFEAGAPKARRIRGRLPGRPQQSRPGRPSPRCQEPPETGRIPESGSIPSETFRGGGPCCERETS